MDQSTPPFFLRTSLDERVAAVCGGCELTYITLIPKLLPISYQTIKNRISKGTFEFEVIDFNNKNAVRTEDLVRFIWEGKHIRKKTGRKVGRRSNKERADRKKTEPEIS